MSRFPLKEALYGRLKSSGCSPVSIAHFRGRYQREMAENGLFSRIFRERMWPPAADLSRSAWQGCTRFPWVGCPSIRGGRVGALERHEPAFALLARSAGEHDLEMQPIHVPRVLGCVGAHLDTVGLEQILGRAVIAMFVLNAAEERELVVRTHVQLEWTEARPSAVIDALTILSIALAARLPVAFEHRTGVIGERTELRLAKSRRAKATGDRESCNPLPRPTPRSHRRSLRGTCVAKTSPGSRRR